MDFDWPGDDDPARIEIRAWLARHPSPTAEQLAADGWTAPHWPAPWGRGAAPLEQVVIAEELKAAGVRFAENPIGMGWAGPTLLVGGTEEQKARWLPGILNQSEIWCQLFSEPDAGSDLASLRTSAVRDGDEWVVTGRKVWTSMGHIARWAILIARTGEGERRQDGLSYFVCPMDAPGIEVRPIVEMTGIHLFNEVTLDEVRIPADHLIGDEGRGWALAKVTLANERVSLSTGGALWGRGPSLSDLLATIPAPLDSLTRQRCAELWIEAEILRLIRLRTVTALAAGKTPGPESSLRKMLADVHGQRLMVLAKDAAGSGGMLTDVGPWNSPVDLWHYGFLFAPALTIGGGTTEVQKNVIAERVLGLPSDN